MRTTAVLIAALVLALPLTAKAAKIDLTQELRDAQGRPFIYQIEPDPAKPRPMTLADACVNALETTTQDDSRLTGEQKFKMDELARQILSKSATPLTVEQIAILKERIGKIYSPAVIGAAWRLLEEQPDAPATKK